MPEDRKAIIEQKVQALLNEIKPDAFMLAFSFNVENQILPARYYKGMGERDEVTHMHKELAKNI